MTMSAEQNRLASHLQLADLPAAEAALLELCRPFAKDAILSPQCTVIQPDEIPFPEDHLLVHHQHMTVVLEKHHGHPVNVHVTDEILDAETDVYTRKVYLTPAASDKVVEWGIARLDLRYLPKAARAEILARQTPLGAVLIKHNVLRRVKPRFFLRFPAGGPVLGLFGAADRTTPAYGRIGTIYCNHEPAIEVLEIVVNT